MMNIEKQLLALSLDKDNFPRMREEKISITVGIALEAAAEIGRLREELATYGDHTYECELKNGSGSCSCGYDAALKGE